MFRGFLFLGPLDFVAGFFLIFVGKLSKCPEKSSSKIPVKILQNLYNKNLQHISAAWLGQVLRSQGPRTEVKIGNQENDIFGVKKCLFGGLGTISMGFLGH